MQYTTNIEEFDVIADTVFVKIYPLLASAALREVDTKEGSCLDLGCGGGHFGLSIAKQSDMYITALDINPVAIEKTLCRAEKWGLSDRIRGIVSDVLDMDKVLSPNSFDLIVSRGSIGFWGDFEAVTIILTIIYNVLAPGGKTFIGNGLGNTETKIEIFEKMKKINADWPDNVKEKTNGLQGKDYEKIARTIDPNAKLIEDDSGMWIVIGKKSVSSG
jgi:SAM-dependent methyltransferase